MEGGVQRNSLDIGEGSLLILLGLGVTWGRRVWWVESVCGRQTMENKMLC